MKVWHAVVLTVEELLLLQSSLQNEIRIRTGLLREIDRQIKESTI